MPVKVASSTFYDVMQEQAAFGSIKSVQQIEYEIPALDEGEYANAVAERTGVEHHHIRIDADEALASRLADWRQSQTEAVAERPQADVADLAEIERRLRLPVECGRAHATLSTFGSFQK